MKVNVLPSYNNFHRNETMNKLVAKGNSKENIIKNSSQEDSSFAIRKAKEFEATMISSMWQSFWENSSLHENSLFGKSVAQDVFQGLAFEAIVTHSFKNKGLGVAEMILKDLEC